VLKTQGDRFLLDQSAMPVPPYSQERIDKLTDPSAFRYCSGEELRRFLAPGPDWGVADFGSGAGLFTTELASVAENVFAVDVRRDLHDIYREHGIPANVAPVTADFANLPFPDNHLDGGVSIRTYHHGFESALDEIARVIRPGGRLVIVDWSATGAGEREGRDDEEYLNIATVQSHLLEVDFQIVDAHERRETFVVIGARR
jgi:SAM-dependent methyltransferase